MKKSLLLVSLIALVGLAACSTTPEVNDDDKNNPNDETPSEVTEVENFEDPVLKDNMEKLLIGFSMQGNITQSRYEYNEDPFGNYLIEGEPLETNLYHSNFAYNGGEEKAFYKYSYREVEGVTITAEGPYTYFEDENGYAYEEVIDYTNVVRRNYNSSMASTNGGLTFGDNGFNNVFGLLIEDDFTLDESVTAFTKYDLNLDKAGLIASTLLYSLNSGATALPTEAYIRADNGVFTQFNIELSPVSSLDSITGDSSLITNSITFSFSNLGTKPISHLVAYEENEDSKKVSDAFKKLEDTSFTLKVNDSYKTENQIEGIFGEGEEEKHYYFTGKEIYYHKVIEGETTSFNKDRDFYLAPKGDSETTGDMHLYPYAYDAATDSFTIREGGLQYEDGTYGYAQGFCGDYLYEDYLPIISDVSGTFFEYDEASNSYVSKEDQVSSLNDCFLLRYPPFYSERQDSIYEYRIKLDDNGSLSSISARYVFNESMDGMIYTGTYTLEFSNVGSTTLEGLIA